MRTFPTDLAALVAHAEIEGLCRLVKVVRADGAVIRFGEVFTPTTFGDGNEYLPGAGIEIGSISLALSDSPSKVDFTLAAVPGAPLDFEDLQDGLYTGATFEVFLADRKGLGTPTSLWFGDMGELTLNSLGLVEFSATGPMGRLRNYLDQLYSGSCRAIFTDPATCKIDPASVTFPDAVVASYDGGRFLVVTGPTAATGNYDLGLVTFTTGPLAGQRREIRSSTLAGSNTTIELYVGFGASPDAGDLCDVRQGCSYDVDPADRTVLTGCLRYSNILNYRGEPWIDPAPPTGTWGATGEETVVEGA
jgi:uncharacterized phage protein (TIGR02218 family)